MADADVPCESTQRAIETVETNRSKEHLVASRGPTDLLQGGERPKTFVCGKTLEKKLDSVLRESRLVLRLMI